MIITKNYKKKGILEKKCEKKNIIKMRVCNLMLLVIFDQEVVAHEQNILHI
jgi:hypothetical protein